MTAPRSTTAYLGLLTANTILASAMPMLIILGGLAGLMLAPSPFLATMPPAVQTLAGLIAAGPFSLLMGRVGRRAGFLVGAGCAALGGVVGVWALMTGSFALLCAAHLMLGAALACYQYFRFAAAEVVPPRWQPVAISLMLTSGLVAAFAGPQIFIWTRDGLFDVPLAGAYAAISVISLVGLLPLLALRLGPPPMSQPLGRIAALAILRRPDVLSAVALGAVAQGTMVFLMAPTPLAMIGQGLSEAMAGDVIRWHVVAMFAPSFITGFVIQRLGARPVAGAGLALLLVSAGVAASGLTGAHFYGSLVLLGLGWNFGFIGATSMLAAAAPPEDRAVAQGANDTVIALAATVCAFASGAIVTGPGWTVLALIAVAILLGALALLWRRPVPA
ncbi:MFS transporter [Jannaschia pohangensis]|uniref:Predicted arabinose efflux permease, MFS family n=1 Tax=Jannaschia pohangensis TaxID=390807 RepID=A0A1I3IH92_9RHOB|nr:MFS transporter [Jannaschia pohangensis]SFI47229.1 Predicted arabinose efflux permease, MFS family [Jannaschia pohangensis]